MNGRSKDIVMSASESKRGHLGNSFLCVEKPAREAAHLAVPESPGEKSKSIQNDGGNKRSTSSELRIFQALVRNIAGEGIAKPGHPIIVNSSQKLNRPITDEKTIEGVSAKFFSRSKNLKMC
jgi:hypothetical protein